MVRPTSATPERILRQALLAGACAGLCACASFQPLSAELEAMLAEKAEQAEQAAPAAPIRRRALLEVEGQRFFGVFEAVLVADAAATSARVQLLPDVGPKFLDLAISPARIAAHAPQAGLALAHARGAGEKPPLDGLSFMAASVLEVLTPLTPGRVRGQRGRPEGGYELLLRPALEGVRVVARIDGEGRLLAREYRLRGARWSERVEDGVRIFEARGSRWTRWTLWEAEPETIAPPPAGLFELELRPDPDASAEPRPPLPLDATP